MPTKAKQPANQAIAESGVPKKSHKKKPAAERIAPKPKPANAEGNSAASAGPVLKAWSPGSFSQRQSMPQAALSYFGQPRPIRHSFRAGRLQRPRLRQRRAPPAEFPSMQPRSGGEQHGKAYGGGGEQPAEGKCEQRGPGQG